MEQVIETEIERNERLMRTFFQEVWINHNPEAARTMLAENVLGNDPTFGTSQESFIAKVKEWIAAFPDIRIDIQDLVAQHHQVAVKWLMTGTHTGEFMGCPPKGNVIKVEGMSIDNFKDGIMVSGSDAFDKSELIKQLTK